MVGEPCVFSRRIVAGSSLDLETSVLADFELPQECDQPLGRPLGQLTLDDSMFSKVLRRLLLVGYAGILLVVFVISSYFAFSTFVRRGEITVAELRGMSLDEARERLERDGITLRWKERHRFDAEIPAGGVVDQIPRSGSLIKKGGVVDVVLSLGRQLVEVPDLSGQTLQTAQVNLKAAGLSLGRLQRVYSGAVDEERIVRQSPVPGTRIDHLAQVDLFLCLGSSAGSFVMPDLVYESYDRVRQFFDSRGFRVGSVKYEPYEGIEPGVVLRQFPLAGHRLAQQDVISLVVASMGERFVGEG